MNTTLKVDGNIVWTSEKLYESLLTNTNFLKLSVEEDGHLYAVFKGAKTRLYKLLPHYKKATRVVFKDKNPLNVTSDNVKLRDLAKKEITPKKTTSLKGTYYQAKKQTKKWRAIISINGKKKSLGYYTTEEQAHQAYLQAAYTLGRR